MSRTRKGSKGPGWEPWSNRDDKAEQAADYVEPEDGPLDDEICPGCPRCRCAICNAPLVAVDPTRADTDVHCLHNCSLLTEQP